MILEWLLFAWLLKRALDCIEREKTVLMSRKEYERILRENKWLPYS